MSTTKVNAYQLQNITENLNAHLRDWTTVMLAHDSVHPDRNECGGIGACLLMCTEHDARTQWSEAAERAVRRGARLSVAADYVRTAEEASAE